MHGHRHDPPRTRRAALRPSSTRDLGMAVHKASMAVADVAPEHGAEVTSLGTIGTRQGDMDQLSRRRPSTATQRIGVYDAGPWGSWRSRDLTSTGYDCWGGGGRPLGCPQNRGLGSTPLVEMPCHCPGWPARVISPRSLSPRWQLPPVARSPGPVTTPAVRVNPPSAVSRPAGAVMRSAPRAGPPGARPP
jgi:hypothetical protein